MPESEKYTFIKLHLFLLDNIISPGKKEKVKLTLMSNHIHMVHI